MGERYTQCRSQLVPVAAVKKLNLLGKIQRCFYLHFYSHRTFTCFSFAANSLDVFNRFHSFCMFPNRIMLNTLKVPFSDQ